MSPSSIEPLESRIAPALVVNPMTVTFEDIDGDNVTIKVSKQIFTNAAAAAALITFTGSMFGDQNSGPQQLDTIDLFSLDPMVDKGMDVSVTAKVSAKHGGNGEISFTHLDASNVDPNNGMGAGLDLGKVVVQGGMNYIDAGDNVATTPALKSLDVRFIGTGHSGVESDIFGSAGMVKVRGSMFGKLTTHVGGAGDPKNGGIMSLSIGGDIGSFAGGLGGVVDVVGSIGTFTLKGNLLGGAAANTGEIHVGKDLQTLTIGGSVLGGEATHTAEISVGGKIGTLAIGGSVTGSNFNDTATITATSIASAKIGRDLTGSQPNGGTIDTTGDLGTLTIGGNVTGLGAAGSTGFINIGGNAKHITVGGSIVGGGGNLSGGIVVNDLGTLVLKGSLVGGTIDFTGIIQTHSIGTATIGGSVHGQENMNGEQAFVAAISAVDHINSLTIAGDLVAGNVSAGINAFNDHKLGTPDDIEFIGNPAGKIGSLFVKGSVSGTTVPSTDAYGIEAISIGSITVGGIAFKQGAKLGATTIDFATGFHLGPTGDFLVRTI